MATSTEQPLSTPLSDSCGVCGKPMGWAEVNEALANRAEFHGHPVHCTCQLSIYEPLEKTIRTQAKSFHGVPFSFGS